jgi:hypothetical protein
MTDNVLSELRTLFITEIMKKNSWGKNEVIELWKDCLIKVLLAKSKTFKEVE